MWILAGLRQKIFNIFRNAFQVMHCIISYFYFIIGFHIPALPVESKGNTVRIGNSSRCCDARPSLGYKVSEGKPLF